MSVDKFKNPLTKSKSYINCDGTAARNLINTMVHNLDTFKLFCKYNDINKKYNEKYLLRHVIPMICDEDKFTKPQFVYDFLLEFLTQGGDLWLKDNQGETGFFICTKNFIFFDKIQEQIIQNTNKLLSETNIFIPDIDNIISEYLFTITCERDEGKTIMYMLGYLNLLKNVSCIEVRIELIKKIFEFISIYPTILQCKKFRQVIISKMSEINIELVERGIELIDTSQYLDSFFKTFKVHSFFISKPSEEELIEKFLEMDLNPE